MKVPINMISLEDAKKTLDDAGIREIENPLYERKGRFPQIGNAFQSGLNYLGFNRYSPGNREAFFKQFELEKEDLAILSEYRTYDYWELHKLFVRPRCKFGDSHLDKIIWRLLQSNHFLAVKNRSLYVWFSSFTVFIS